jgi:ATP adenylyltransferase
VPLDRFSAAWREHYVSGQDAAQNAAQNAAQSGECVFCRLGTEEASEASGVLVHAELTYVVLNAFPYGSGHLLVLPRRHVANLQDLTDDEYEEFFWVLRRTVVALEAAYGPDGLNVGMNLGQAAGAGIPKHLHGHVLPRWNGDTNFMTSIGETRVLPESLESTWQKVRAEI